MLHRGLEGGLAFGQPACPPVTPSEVQLRLAEERALRKLLYQRVEGGQRKLEAVGCRGCIGRGIGDLVGVHTCLVLAEAQFTQRQQRQIRQSSVGVLAQEVLQRFRCLGDLILCH